MRWGMGLLMALALLPAGLLGAAPSREIVMVVDTSRSMAQNDPRRYTSILAQVIGDLVAPQDLLTVVRMPDGNPSCTDGPDRSLALKLESGARDFFKARVDQRLVYNVGTHFAAPVRTALQQLAASPAAARLLLVIADSDGLGDCSEELTRELQQAAGTGVKIAGIHLGGGSGAFDGNPAFELNQRAGNAEDLARAVATVYQRLLGVRQVQYGRVEGNRLQFEIEPHLREAFLVVLADGEIGRLAKGITSPEADDLDQDFRGGGGARGLDGRRRAFRIVHLVRPQAGRWTVEAPELRDLASWLLIQDSAIGLRQIGTSPPGEGREGLVEIELYDELTGGALSAAEARSFSSLELEVGGRMLPLRDDGAGGDRMAGDGIFSLRVAAPPAGVAFTVHGESAFLERRLTLTPPALPVAIPVPVTERELPGRLDPGSMVAKEGWEGCWWPMLVAAAVALTGGLCLHGFWAPSRFPPHLGLVLAPEENLAEGFFYPFRAQKGSGSGFHRDARLFLHADFRLGPSARGALARLRAGNRRICLLPLERVWRRDGDGSWEELPAEERALRVGVLHRNGTGTLFFELRNGSAKEI